MPYPKNRKSSSRKGMGLGTPKTPSERPCTQCATPFLGNGGAKYCSWRCVLSGNSVREGDCIVWQGYARPEGYGEVDFNGRRLLSNRAAWIATTGEEPGKLCVCHRCDNRRCVRFEHLFLGTRAENNADRDAKERQARGEKLWSAKLTEEQVRAIRADPRTHRETAKDYGVYETTISEIRSGRLWKHVV